MSVIETMNRVKTLTSLFLKLRKQLNIPLRQPLLDYGFGGIYLMRTVEKEYYDILCNAINIHNLGYDFASLDWYYGNETVKPQGDNWKILEEDGIWVALDISMPDWLAKIGEKRKEQREEIMKNKLHEASNT